MGMDADVLEEQAKTCNHKKMNAKTAGELSTDLFFKLFVKVSFLAFLIGKVFKKILIV